MDDKIELRCPKCNGVLFQMWDESKLRQIYYKETMRCLTCGHDFYKIDLLQYFNINKKELKFWR